MKSSNQNSNVKMPFTRRPQLILFILTACCVISMGYYYIKKENIVSVGQVAGAITVPVQKGVNKLGSIFFNFDQERLSKEEAMAKIESLEDENKELKEQMVSYDQKIQEYQDMRALLELKSEYADYDTVGATVIFSDMTGNWFSTFTIDKGTDDGLEVGMNVLSGGGLVGYICVVTGDLPYMKEHGLLKLQYMDTDFNISRDNVIVTSNISDRYLPGLVIGYAQDVTVDENGLAASGYLKPAADFKHIRNVLVVTTQKQSAE